MDNNGKENRECNACSIHIITPNINALANEQNVWKTVITTALEQYID